VCCTVVASGAVPFVADFSQSCKFTVALACVFFHLSPVIGVSWWGIWIVGGLGGEVVVGFFSPFCVLVRICSSAFLSDYKVQSDEASHGRRVLNGLGCVKHCCFRDLSCV
jgi:hypothetical protein